MFIHKQTPILFKKFWSCSVIQTYIYQYMKTIENFVLEPMMKEKEKI